MAISPGRPNTKEQLNRGFFDPSGEYPRINHINDASTNKVARGQKVNRVYISGGEKGVDLGLQPLHGSQYPKNNITETEGGHVFEMDDTPSNERIVILHSSKAGIEIRPDGTVIISSGAEGNKIEIVGNDHRMIVERNGDVHYKGNLNFKVDGDMNLDIGGSLTTKIGGNETITIGGTYNQTIEKSHISKIKKNKSEYVLGVNTNITLSDKETHVKGNENKFIQGDVVNSIGGSLTLTSKDEMVISTSNANIAATNMTVVGATGTIGGEGMTMYATTFIGDLTGTALFANQAAGLGPVGTYTNQQTVKPTSGIMSDYLNNSSLGIRNVNVDPGNAIFNYIDFNEEFSNISSSRLDSAELKSKFRNDTNLTSPRFLGSMVGDELVTEEIAKNIPPKVGRVISKKVASFGEKPIGQTTNPLLKAFKER